MQGFWKLKRSTNKEPWLRRPRIAFYTVNMTMYRRVWILVIVVLVTVEVCHRSVSILGALSTISDVLKQYTRKPLSGGRHSLARAWPSLIAVRKWPATDDQQSYEVTLQQRVHNLMSLHRIQQPALMDKEAHKPRVNKNICPEVPSGLIGFAKPSTREPSMSELEHLARTTSVVPGGHWSPSNCRPSHSVAVIIPYKDRPSQLKVFLAHIHPFLQRQLANYTLYVIEQMNPSLFNRGALLNIGFLEVHRRRHNGCYILHDVDMLPENDHNVYRCGVNPVHQGVYVDTMQYRPRLTIVGGVLTLKATHMVSTNGFSNTFWGWGGEDDDMNQRLTRYRGYMVEIPSWPEGKYTMIPHTSNHNVPDTHHRQRGTRFHGTDYAGDGLSSVRYEVDKVTSYPLYTKISINIMMTP